MTDTKHAMDELDQLLNEVARAPVPEVSATLEARLMHEAERLMPPAPPRREGWGSVVRGLGGWRALGGLATAAAAGVWIGFAAPGALSALTSDVVTLSVYDDLAWSEVEG